MTLANKLGKSFESVSQNIKTRTIHIDLEGVKFDLKVRVPLKKEIEEIQKSWNGIGVAPVMTKRLEFMIKSVKGNRDPMNIRNFIENLPIKDSQDFRKYTTDNRPGINLIKKAIAPSGEEVQFSIGFGVEFFRPFYGV